MTIKNLLLKIKRDSQTSMLKMSVICGLHKRSLYQKVKVGTITVKELQKCLKCAGASLVIVYDDQQIKID